MNEPRWLGLGLLIFFQVNLVAAHAVVTDYSLKIAPIHAYLVDKVELTFNSRIERALSQVFLVSKGDKLTLLNIADGNKQGQIIATIPALAPGKYALKFKIFAADGHLTEDIIYFSVVS